MYNVNIIIQHDWASPRECKGGRAVQFKRLKKSLYTNGTFNSTKIFPKETITPEQIIPQTKDPSPLKAYSSPRPHPQPTAKDTFCPKKIPTRPCRSLASIKNSNVCKPTKPKIISVTNVDGLVTIIDAKMLKLNLRNK